MDSSKKTSSLTDIEQYGRSPSAKSPRFPGSEKFKFADHRPSSPTVTTDGVFLRGTSSRKTCPERLSTSGGTEFSRSDAKRKPILPISCQKTSRMLTLTNRPLSVDCLDVRVEDPPSNRRSPLLMLRSSLADSQGSDDDSDRPPDKRISLPIGVEARLGHLSLRDPNYTPNSAENNGKVCTNDNNFRSLAVNRLSSSSCGSSSASEQDVWLPRKPTT